MPAERYFIHSELQTGSTVPIEGAEFHHMAHVMRSKEGDHVEIVNGSGFLSFGEIRKMSKHSAQIYLHQAEFTPKKSFEIILAQGIPRINRLDYLIEKATELGMTQLWLLPTARSERKSFTQEQLIRFQSIAISAMKQCGSLWLPSITVYQPLMSLSMQPYPLFFGDLDPKAPLFTHVWENNLPKQGVIFVTGPESGLTNEEIDHLCAIKGVGVKLNDHVLRTDTASILAVGLMAFFVLK